MSGEQVMNLAAIAISLFAVTISALTVYQSHQMIQHHRAQCMACADSNEPRQVD